VRVYHDEIILLAGGGGRLLEWDGDEDFSSLFD